MDVVYETYTLLPFVRLERIDHYLRKSNFPLSAKKIETSLKETIKAKKQNVSYKNDNILFIDLTESDIETSQCNEIDVQSENATSIALPNIKCIVCNEIFNDRIKLHEHATLTHSETKIYFCEYCTQLFFTDKILQNHKKECHETISNRDISINFSIMEKKKVIPKTRCPVKRKNNTKESISSHEEVNMSSKRYSSKNKNITYSVKTCSSGSMKNKKAKLPKSAIDLKSDRQFSEEMKHLVVPLIRIEDQYKRIVRQVHKNPKVIAKENVTTPETNDVLNWSDNSESSQINFTMQHDHTYGLCRKIGFDDSTGKQNDCDKNSEYAFAIIEDETTKIDTVDKSNLLIEEVTEFNVVPLVEIESNDSITGSDINNKNNATMTFTNNNDNMTTLSRGNIFLRDNSSQKISQVINSNIGKSTVGSTTTISTKINDNLVNQNDNAMAVSSCLLQNTKLSKETESDSGLLVVPSNDNAMSTSSNHQSQNTELEDNTESHRTLMSSGNNMTNTVPLSDIGNKKAGLENDRKFHSKIVTTLLKNVKANSIRNTPSTVKMDDELLNDSTSFFNNKNKNTELKPGMKSYLNVKPQKFLIKITTPNFTSNIPYIIEPSENQSSKNVNSHTLEDTNKDNNQLNCEAPNVSKPSYKDICDGKCLMCKRTIKIMKQMFSYVNTKSTIKCPFCNLHFLSLNDIECHVRSEHLCCKKESNVVEIDLVTSDEVNSANNRLMNCLLCEQSFDNFKDFEAHSADIHAAASTFFDNSSNDEPNYLSDLPVTCTITKRKDNIIKTIALNKKLSSKKTIFSCCNNIFNNIRDYLKHSTANHTKTELANNTSIINCNPIKIKKSDNEKHTVQTLKVVNPKRIDHTYNCKPRSKYIIEERRIDNHNKNHKKLNESCNNKVSVNEVITIVDTEMCSTNRKLKKRSEKRATSTVDPVFIKKRKLNKTNDKLDNSTNSETPKTLKEDSVSIIELKLDHHIDNKLDSNSEVESLKKQETIPMQSVKEMSLETDKNDVIVTVRSDKPHSINSNTKQSNIVNPPKQIGKNGNKEKAYVCEYCLREFKLETGFLQHCYIAHQDDSGIHICENCDKLLFSVSMVNAHLCSDVRTFYCHRCKLGFTSSMFLKLHNINQHYEKNGPHKCNVCEKKFLTNFMLEKHKSQQKCNSVPDIGMIKNENKEIKLIENSVEIIDNDNSEGLGRMSSKELLTVLQDNDSGSGSIEELVCMNPIHFGCGADNFSNKPLKATDKLSISNQSVIVKFHNNCNINDPNFQYIAYVHLDGMMPYVCNICQIKFTTRSGVRSHLTRTHKLYGDICQLCYRFYKPNYLTLHILVHHLAFDSTKIKTLKDNSDIENTIKQMNQLIKVIEPFRLLNILEYKVQEKKPFICEICSVKTDTQIYPTHFFLEHDTSCVLCDISFENNAKAIDHKILYHRSVEAYVWAIDKIAGMILSSHVYGEKLQDIRSKFIPERDKMMKQCENRTPCLIEPVIDNDEICFLEEETDQRDLMEEISDYMEQFKMQYNTLQSSENKNARRKSAEILMIHEDDIKKNKNNINGFASKLSSVTQLYSKEYIGELLTNYLKNNQKE